MGEAMAFLPRRAGDRWEVFNVHTGEVVWSGRDEVRARQVALEASGFLQQRIELAAYETRQR